MYIDDIKTASPFRDLFPVRKRVLEDIMWDMRRNGYDNSQPLVLWKDHSNVIIDGHTRLSAAKKANIYQIPIVFKAFSDEEAALKYAISCQKNRRNLTDSELVACVVELDKKMRPGQRNDLVVNLAPDGARLGKSAEETANLLGVSTRKVERIRAVMDNAPDKIKRMVKTGRMTLNSAYNRTIGARRNGKFGKAVLDDFCALTIKRFDREELRYIADVFNKELSKPKENDNESA
ncbi:MAG: ParB/RepB/Spo0J family partition protein [Victivallaceae bacterium]|nr:ParB/RepB/Spo0J family partition protein [Victivallaceae bacterium]